MADKDTGFSFTTGFILGAVVGVAIGFLYAPKPGKETRELLKEKAEKAKAKADEVAEKAKETAAETRGRVEEKLSRRKTAK